MERRDERREAYNLSFTRYAQWSGTFGSDLEQVQNRFEERSISDYRCDWDGERRQSQLVEGAATVVDTQAED